MTDKHISFTADKRVWKFLKKKSIEEESSMKELILSALKEKYDLDQGIKKSKEGEEKGADIELSDLSEEVIDLSKELEGGKLGSDRTVREITLGCLRYLKNQGEGTHKDFKNNVYPEFEEDHTEGSFWKVARSGLKQIEEKEGIVKTPSKGHSKYIWKG